MDLFSSLNEQLKSNTKRWVKIDEMANKIKAGDYKTDDLATLLLLIVEQLTPARGSEQQVKDLQADITNMLNKLPKGFKVNE